MDGVDENLQLDLDMFSTRAESWNLTLDANKCVVMRFGSSTPSDQGTGYSINGQHMSFVNSHKDLGVIVDTKMRFHEHVRGVVNRSKGLVNQLLRGTICRSRHFMIKLFISHIRPLMDFSARLWNVGYLGYVRSLEQVQRCWVSQTEGMEDLQYEACLKQLGVYSVYGRLLRGDLIKIWQAFHPTSDVGLAGLFDMQSHTATRSNGFKLAIPRCRTELRRRFWNVRCVQTWNGLPSEIVQARTVDSFKRKLDNHVGNLFFSTV